MAETTMDRHAPRCAVRCATASQLALVALWTALVLFARRGLALGYATMRR
jgi:class 3 adenylate cyclase